MSDDQNNNTNNDEKFSHLSEEQKQKAEKAVAKLSSIKAMRKLSNDNSKWSLLQEIFQEIVATHTIANPDKLPPIKQMSEELRIEVTVRHQDDEELRDLLIDSIPSDVSIKKWMSKDGWNDAIWAKVRINGLFTKEKRAQMIDSLWRRGVEKSDTAAKIWLTISGDYSEATPAATSKTVDMYREINNILHGAGKDTEKK